MRILQLIHIPQHRGAEIFTCQLSNHLLLLGHEVKIVSVFDAATVLPFNGGITSLKASSAVRFIDISSWRRLAGLIKDYEPDIIQTNAGDTLKYAVFSKLFYGWKHPIIVRNASEVGLYIHSPFQKFLNAFFYKNVTRVISVSKASETDILKNFPFLSGKTCVIPVGLETDPIIKNKKLIPVNSRHLVHVGGFTFEKNHKGLIRIFHSLILKRSNIHLHLIGDGPLRCEVEEIVRKLGLTENITLYGFVKDPLLFIHAADALVLPSIIEGLPGVLLEAMYCKTPVIAYDVGGISEIVTPETGRLIEKNDEEAFVGATLQTLNNPDKNQIERAHRMVVKDFMNPQIAERFGEVYRML